MAPGSLSTKALYFNSYPNMYCTAVNTVVLCPGFLSPPGKLVFIRVLRVLEANGCEVLVTSAPLIGGIGERANALRAHIIEYFGSRITIKPTVHLVGKLTVNLKTFVK
jgi:hypothetical protein